MLFIKSDCIIFVPQFKNDMTKHKAGFVNILGNPNVGKSTLMNALVGEKISIITSKAQTTRHRIMGIVNGEDFQIVYSDTPGILKANYKLQESMMKFVQTAISDADIILYVTDTIETRDKNEEYIEKINKSDVPVLLIINKIDLIDQEKLIAMVEDWQQLIPRAKVFPASALNKFNLDQIFNELLFLLPEGEAFYPKDDTITDKTERFIVSEIIREKILLKYQKEIPYSAEVEVESFTDEAKQIRISAIIYVIRDSQKGILIGHKGSSLKWVGTEARLDIEEFFGKKVFLELFVKVNKDWRNNDNQLKKFGYHS